MQEFVTEIMGSFGYAGIFILILAENLFPPIPSEVILTFGGFMTTVTSMNTAGVIMASTLGSVAGAVILYYAGRLIPGAAFEKLVDGKLGKSLHFDKGDIEDAMKWFDSKGRITVFLCRCVPIVRSLISIPAGMAGMKMLPFLFLTAAGSLVWNTVLVSAGAFAGSSWGKILDVMHTYSNATVLAAGAAAFAAGMVYFGKKKEKRE